MRLAPSTQPHPVTDHLATCRVGATTVQPITTRRIADTVPALRKAIAIGILPLVRNVTAVRRRQPSTRQILAMLGYHRLRWCSWPTVRSNDQPPVHACFDVLTSASLRSSSRQAGITHLDVALGALSRLACHRRHRVIGPRLSTRTRQCAGLPTPQAFDAGSLRQRRITCSPRANTNDFRRPRPVQGLKYTGYRAVRRRPRCSRSPLV